LKAMLDVQEQEGVQAMGRIALPAKE
jgi:hypothetical protein